MRGWRERVIGTSHLGCGTERVAEIDAEWRQVELRRWGYERDPSVGEALALP